MNVSKRLKKAAALGLVAAQLATVGAVMPMVTASAATSMTRQVEALDRGVVAVKTDAGVFLSWRRLGTEAEDTQFTVYRDGQAVATGAITNYVDKDGTKDSKYVVATNGTTMSKEVSVWENQYLSIPLQDPPESGMYDYSNKPVKNIIYTPGDSSVGDLDGDGEYEIVMLWNPNNAHDAATSGFSAKVYMDAYKMDGTFLWRIDMGVNIRAGAHDTQLLVYDFNGDGKAEVVVRTADGTVAGDGTVIGDATKNWAELNNGKNLQGPLYLTAFEGATGKVIDTVPFDPQTEDIGKEFGDDFGNRSERYLATVAYINGTTPSIVEQRGYYGGKNGIGPGRTVVSTYDLQGNKLVQKWRFDTREHPDAVGQGNHSMTAGDVDGDGFDEIISGSLALDHDGKILWNTGYGHGDAHHLGDFDPRNPGLEYMKVYEGCQDAPGFMGARNQTWGLTVQDAKTGKVLQSRDGIKDTGRGMIANIGYKDKFYVVTAAGSTGTYDSDDNDVAGTVKSMPVNGRIYWDGGLSDQMQDHVTISKWNDAAAKFETIFTADGESINGTKGNINMQGDIIGDWREEILTYKMIDNKEENTKVKVDVQGEEREVDAVISNPKYELRLYTTVIPTEYNFYTFMHDDIYRISDATYNVAYNQPPHISFYLSDTIDGYKTQPAANVKPVGDFKEAAFDSSKLSGTGAPVETPSAKADGIVLKIDSTKALTDGTVKNVPVAPQIVDGRTLVPVRFISENMGGTVGFEAETQKVSIDIDGKHIEMFIGNNTMTVDGNEIALDVAPAIFGDGTTMIPFRALCENALGKSVEWNEANRLVLISSSPKTYDDATLAEYAQKLN
jgi:hypothetical protein